MDPTIIAAIIGALATITAAVSTFLFPKIKSRRGRSRKSQALSQQIEPEIPLAGPWTGIVYREAHLGEPLEMQFTASFIRRVNPSNPTMLGTGKLTYKCKNDTITKCMDIQGEVLRNQFLVLTYTLKDYPETIQFGRVILELKPDGRRLEGRFLGFSPINERIVGGTVHVERI